MAPKSLFLEWSEFQNFVVLEDSDVLPDPYSYEVSPHSDSSDFYDSGFPHLISDFYSPVLNLYWSDYVVLMLSGWKYRILWNALVIDTQESISEMKMLEHLTVFFHWIAAATTYSEEIWF